MVRTCWAALAPVLLAASCLASREKPEWGIHGYFCFADSAGMSLEASEDCWRLLTGNLTAPEHRQRGTLLMAKWSQLEPTPGVFSFSELERNITLAVAKGYDITLMVEIVKGDGSSTPQWLFSEGVPLVRYKSGGELTAPYYLSPRFQFFFRRLIGAFAGYVRGLAPAVAERVVSVQIATGITGDDRPWNGVPLNSSYIISDADWKVYTRNLSMAYCDAFRGSGVGMLINLDNVGGVGQNDSYWFNLHCDTGGPRLQKQGIVSHGYQLNGEMSLYTSDGAGTLLTEQPWGDFGRARGELALDATPLNGTYGNWAESPSWSLHANALWAITFGLDIWNLYSPWILNETFAPTLDLFNRHAGVKDPSKATAAVIGLRDGLDSSDFRRFPESVFGHDQRPFSCPEPPCGRNATRMELIAQAFASRGARQDDPKAATGKLVKQKKAMGLNDVGWQIWTGNSGNYGNFITQRQPDHTSVGWWRVGPKDRPYGRFSRGSNNSQGMDAMYFDLDDRLFGGLPFPSSRVPPVRIDVVWLDRDPNSTFAIRYDSQSEHGKYAKPFATGSGSGEWRNFSVTLQDARFGNGDALDSDFSVHTAVCGAPEGCPDSIVSQIEVSLA